MLKLDFFAALINMEEHMVLLQHKIISNERICNCPGRLKQGKYLKQIVSLVMDLDELKALCNFKCAAHYVLVITYRRAIDLLPIMTSNSQ